MARRVSARRIAVVVPADVRRAVLTHARREHPRECCGFLIGQGQRVQFAVAMANVARRAECQFRVADRDHIALRRLLRQFAPPLEIVGVYHSHPAGKPYPSATDLADAHYSDWMHLIAGRVGGRPTLGAFSLANGLISPLDLARPTTSGRGVSSSGRPHRR